MPPVSEKQRRAMWAAASGHSTLGIPKEVGEEFVRADTAPAPELGDLNDYEAAEAVRDNELPSPTKYGDFWLFDLRITGTGHAYRDSIDEWAVRDPVIWTSPEFVERCNGLPVIFEHPERSGLDHDEFRNRIIGSIFLPYVRNDEVWGIAKIYNADAAELMQTTHRSTSPGVTPPKGSEASELKDGTKVLAEELPLVLDHLAVCAAGVWDKDGPPAGIRLDARLDRKDASVTEEEKKALEKERDDAKMRAEAAESKLAAIEDKARKDAEETEKEGVKAAEESKGEKIDKKKDAVEMDRKDGESDEAWDARKKDAAKKDASGEERVTPDKKDRKDGAPEKEPDAERGMHLDSKFAAIERDNAELRRRLDAMSVQPSIEDRNAIASAFHRADSIYQMLGDSTPLVIPGESPIAYRRRLASGLRKYSDRWKTYAFHDSIDGHAFELIERSIYEDAEHYAKSPSTESPGVLRAVKDTTSMPGKVITRFYGDSLAAWTPFMSPTKHRVKQFNNTPDRRT